MRSPELPLRHAAALGALHGPAELLPISSSGHITLVPWLVGWPYCELDPESRKSFEVALHAGTAAALLLLLRGEVASSVRELDRRRAVLIALSFAPAALTGYMFERPIERLLGTPQSIATGLVLGSLAMALADARGPRVRAHADAGALDGLLLGLAQACALMPGVSRNGATLAVARARGFERADATVLSRHCALPIIVGAVALKSWRLRQGKGLLGPQLGVGALAAFLSTILSARALEFVESERSLAPYGAYRIALAALVVRRLRQTPGR